MSLQVSLSDSNGFILGLKIDINKVIFIMIFLIIKFTPTTRVPGLLQGLNKCFKVLELIFG